MRKHTRCCSLQTSTANPYSRGTSPQTVPNSSTKGTRPVWPNFPTNSLVHAHWFLGSRSQTNLTILNKDHNTEQIKTRIHTCALTQKYKAWVTHVMLARSNSEVLIHFVCLFVHSFLSSSTFFFPLNHECNDKVTNLTSRYLPHASKTYHESLGTISCLFKACIDPTAGDQLGGKSRKRGESIDSE